MSWEKRRERGQYYTRSVRRDGRVMREYIGIGPVAELVATMDAADRTERAARRAAHAEERTAVAAARTATAALDRETKTLVRDGMAAAGYRQHARGNWRKRRMANHEDAVTDTDDPLLPPGAGPGPDGPTFEEVHAFLHGKPPPPPRTAPDGLARQAECAWADLIAGPDPAIREVLDQKVGEFRAGFGATDSPLERILIDQLVVGWLESYFFATRAADTAPQDLAVGHREFLLRAADRASRRVVHLTKQLATLRRLLPQHRPTATPAPEAEAPVVPKKRPRGRRRSAASSLIPAQDSTATSGGAT